MVNDTVVLPRREKKPNWLRVKLPVGKKYTELRGLVDKYKLNTICTSGSCCLLYTSPSPRDRTRSRMPSSA